MDGSVSNEKITIKYTTERNSCRCCHRSLDKPEISKVKEFTFSKESFEGYGIDWSIYDSSEIEEVTREFVYETIDFFAVSNHDMIVLQDGEMERMYQFARECVLN